MPNKQDYLMALREAVVQMHGCEAFWIRTQHVHETFKGKTAWDGDVEVFGLVGHEKALHAYAWADKPPDGGEPRFIAVLEIPPVTTALKAVQVSLVADSKRAQSQS